MTKKNYHPFLRFMGLLGLLGRKLPLKLLFAYLRCNILRCCSSSIHLITLGLKAIFKKSTNDLTTKISMYLKKIPQKLKTDFIMVTL